ncbi:hypothetical protein DSAG12_02163 [Promethearchaeum syntrophicum]|uniref:Uncharacterized protein n=1 Tax=Promethearchaeum syntrophicum TaxID=2594042 RepID=A0A5B9DB03_9ARCH
MDPFYVKVDEIKHTVEEKNYELSLSLYSVLIETFTEPYHEFEIKRLNLDKLMATVSKKYFKRQLDENITYCQDMIKNNDVEQAKIYLDKAKKSLGNLNSKFIISQKIKLRKLKKEIAILETPLDVYPEPDLDECIDDKLVQTIIPEFDEKYYKATSELVDGSLKQNGYSRIKIIPESLILENIYRSFDHLYYKIHNDPEDEPALLSLIFVKVESSKGNINLRYPEVDYKPMEQMGSAERHVILNDVVHFPIRIFKHLLTTMAQKDYESFRITTEIFEDLLVKVFPHAEILQHPLRVKSGAKQMEIDAHGIILLKKSLYQTQLPGLRSDHIYFLTQANLQPFIDFEDKKYFAYISAKKETIENYDSPKQKHGFFSRQSKIGFIITPLLFISALAAFLNQELLTPFLIFDSVLAILTVGHGIFQKIFGEAELYRISEWCILSRDIRKWDKVFGFLADEHTINLISAECSNFGNHQTLRDPKKFTLPFLHNFSLKMFLKRKKLQKYYIDPATTKIKTKSKEFGQKIKEKTIKISTTLKKKPSRSPHPPKFKIKHVRDRGKSTTFSSTKPKMHIKKRRKLPSPSPLSRNSIKLTSINSFLED